MVINSQNVTFDDVKKIVATLNVGDIPSTDVVGKYFFYRIQHQKNKSSLYFVKLYIVKMCWCDYFNNV